MVKRTISMLLALVLVVICVFPALAVPARAEETDSSTEGSELTGYSLQLGSPSSSAVKDFWKQISIYNIFNSGSGDFLFGSNHSGTRAFFITVYSNGLISSSNLSTLAPYTSLTYPFFSLNFGPYGSGSVSSGDLFSSYSNAYAHWLKIQNEYFFLTEDSYFEVGSTSSTGDCYVFFYKVGRISRSGDVSFGNYKSIKFSTYDSIYQYYTDAAYIPGDSGQGAVAPTISGFSPSWSWQTVEQGSAPIALTVNATSPNDGVLSYSWEVRNMKTGAILPITDNVGSSIVASTDEVGIFSYSCRVTNSYPSGSWDSFVSWTIEVYPETAGAGENITWRILSDGTLYISGSGLMNDYSTASGKRAPWYEYKDSITSIVVSEGIISIGNYAFYQLSKATSVSLPNSLKTIGTSAFGLTGLTSVIVPEGVTHLGPYCFQAYKLVVAVLPSTLSSVDIAIFHSSSSLTHLYIYASSPPSFSHSTQTILGTVSKLSTIYVPYGSGESYKLHEYWGIYADKIVEMESQADPIDTIEELGAIVEQILAELEELNQSKSILASILDAINNWGQQIVDAIGGGFTTDKTPDEFEEKLDDTLTQLGAAGDAMANVQRPDHSAIDFNVGAMVSQSGVAVLASCFSDMMAFEGLQTLVITFVTLSLAAFVLFGRG